MEGFLVVTRGRDGVRGFVVTDRRGGRLPVARSRRAVVALPLVSGPLIVRVRVVVTRLGFGVRTVVTVRLVIVIPVRRLVLVKRLLGVVNSWLL